MPRVSNQDDGVVLARELDGLQVNLRDQGAGRVDHLELAALGFVADCRRYSMRAKNDARTLRHLRQLLYKDGSRLAQFVHYVPVVDDLLTHIDRRTVEVEHDLDDIDRPHHARAKTTRPE